MLRLWARHKLVLSLRRIPCYSSVVRHSISLWHHIHHTPRWSSSITSCMHRTRLGCPTTGTMMLGSQDHQQKVCQHSQHSQEHLAHRVELQCFTVNVCWSITNTPTKF